jgi:hypothetical protein
MEHNQIVKAIQFIRPDAEWSLTATELTWLDKNQTEPSKKQIEDGWVAYQAAEKAKADNIAAQKQEVLEKLGLTAEEVSALLA